MTGPWPSRACLVVQFGSGGGELSAIPHEHSIRHYRRFLRIASEYNDNYQATNLPIPPSRFVSHPTMGKPCWARRGWCVRSIRAKTGVVAPVSDRYDPGGQRPAM